MSSEVELERLIVRLMGDGTTYQKMLADATVVTDQLGKEMKRLGGTEAEFSAITARAANVTQAATEATRRHEVAERNLQTLLGGGLIARGNFNKLIGSSEAVLNSATNAVVKHSEAVARGLQVTRGSENAVEAYKRKIAELDKLIDDNAISQETYNRTAERLNNQLPRTIALRQQEAAAVRAAAQAHREAEMATARASAQSQKDFIASEKQLAAAIREGALAEQKMIKQDQSSQLRNARYATLAQADAEKELARVRKQCEGVTKEMMTAQERYADRIKYLNGLLQQNAGFHKTYERAVIAAQKAMRESLIVVNTLGKDISRAGMSLRGFGTSWSIYVSAPLGAFLGASTMAGVKMDSLTRGLTAITHSSAKTRRELEDMLDVAKLPGLGFKEAVEGDIRLQATGFSASLAKRSLLAFGNALATVGKGKADLDGIILALTQISAKGKVMAQEINQLGERVPQIRKVMEQAFGTADTEKIQRMGLSSKEFIEMIVTELEKLPKVTGGARNDLENFADAAFVAFSKVGESIIKIITPAVKWATEMLTVLGNVFDYLSPSTQLLIVASLALAAAIGPIAVIGGQATIAIGGLATAYTYLIGTTWGLVAAQAALAATPFAAAAAMAYLAYEISGMGMAQQALRKEMELSTEITNEFAQSMNRAAVDTMGLADAMEGAARGAFIEKNLSSASEQLDIYSSRLDAAKERLLDVMHWSEGGRALTTIDELTGKVAIAQTEVDDLTTRFKQQNDIVKQWKDKMASATVPSQLEAIKQQTMLNREADTYIKSIERKIETLARGEAMAKVADLTDRGIDSKRIERMNELIAKQEDMQKAKAAKTESDKLEKDIESLTAKLNAQIVAFGGVKYATDIQALAERDLAEAFTESLAAADAKAKELDDLKKAADLADDVEKLNAKLRAEVAELKSGTDASEIFALSHRGAKDAVLETAMAFETAMALEAEKKSLKEAADLVKDMATFTDNLAAQVATFGMASEEADLYKFALRGATEEQLAMARAVNAQKKVLEENKKLIEDGKKLTEKHQPKLKFLEDYKELNKMLAIGAINQDTFAKETKVLEKALEDAQAKADVRVRFTVEGNEAVRAGTAEFTKMIAEAEKRASGAMLSADIGRMKSEVEAASLTATAPPAEPWITTSYYNPDRDATPFAMAEDIGESVVIDDSQPDWSKVVSLWERIAEVLEQQDPGVVLSEMGAGE